MAVNHTEAMPPQLRAARVRKQRVIKAIILTFTLLFLFVPLVSMFVFTIRHPLSGKWSLDPWIAISPAMAARLVLTCPHCGAVLDRPWDCVW